MRSYNVHSEVNELTQLSFELVLRSSSITETLDTEDIGVPIDEPVALTRLIDIGRTVP